jgi:uncharacterized membrane protein YidH (DUF202 family)
MEVVGIAPVNRAKYVHYRLIVEITMATWIRNALSILIIVVAMDDYQSWSSRTLTFTAMLFVWWATYGYYRNTVAMSDRIPSAFRQLLPYHNGCYVLAIALFIGMLGLRKTT